MALLPLQLAAQTLFDRAYSSMGDTLGGFFANMAVTPTVDEEIYSASGNTWENGVGTPWQLIIAQRTAADGSPLWRRKYLHVNDHGFAVFGAGGLSDGTLITYGAGQGTLSGNKGMFMHATSTGQPMAAKWYTHSATSTTVEGVHELNDSILLVCGGTQSGLGYVGWFGLSDYDGDIINARYVGYGSSTRFNHITPCPGGSLLTGPSTRIVNPDTTLWGLAIARIDDAGNVLWAERLEEQDPSGLFYAKGAYAVPGGFRVFASARKQGTQHDDILMIALDDQGAVQWQERIWFTTFSGGCPIAGVMELSDGTYCVAGGYGSAGRATVVLDSSGTVLSAYANGGGPGGATMRDVARAADGTLISIAMVTDPNGSGDFVPRITKDQIVPFTCAPVALTHTISTGDLAPFATWADGPISVAVAAFTSELVPLVDLPDAYDQCIVTAIAASSDDDRLSLFPNPGHDRVTIAGGMLEQVEVFDAIGRKVLEERIVDTRSTELDVQALPPGLYHVRAWNGARWMGGALVKE